MLPTVLAIALGVCTALAFTLPTLGRTLNLSTARLIRGNATGSGRTPAVYVYATVIICVLALALLLWFIPEPLVAAAFIVGIIVLLGLLECMVRLIQWAGGKLSHSRLLDGQFTWRLAVASLHLSLIHISEPTRPY